MGRRKLCLWTDRPSAAFNDRHRNRSLPLRLDRYRGFYQSSDDLAFRCCMECEQLTHPMRRCLLACPHSGLHLNAGCSTNCEPSRHLNLQCALLAFLSARKDKSPVFGHSVRSLESSLYDMRVSYRPVLLRAARLRSASAAPRGNLLQPRAIQLRMSTVAEASSTTSHPSSSPQPQHNFERQQRAKQILREAVAATAPRHDWTRDEISAIYYQPLMELAYQAVSIPKHHLGLT